jgi:carbon-monoxide dehydrogenase large subunit
VITRVHADFMGRLARLRSERRPVLYADVQYPHRVRNAGEQHFKIPAQDPGGLGDVGGAFGTKGWQYRAQAGPLGGAQAEPAGRWQCDAAGPSWRRARATT